MNRRPVQERVEEFLAKNPEAMDKLLVYEIREIRELGYDVFDMIMTAFCFGYMKASKNKKGGNRS